MTRNGSTTTFEIKRVSADPLEVKLVTNLILMMVIQWSKDATAALTLPGRACNLEHVDCT